MATLRIFCVVFVSTGIFCAAKSISSTNILRRLEYLETRDTEISARIFAIEQKEKDYRERLQQLTEQNEALNAAVEHYRCEIKDKETIIDGLKSEVQQLADSVDRKEKLVESLQLQLTDLDRKFEIHAHTIKNMDTIQLKQSKKIDYLETLVKMRSSEIYAQPNLKENNEWQKDNDQSKEHKQQPIHDQMKEIHSERLPLILNRRIIQVPAEENGERHQTRAVSNLVAFHAVITTSNVDYIGNWNTIVFDNVLLNTGGGYHGQHGLFIALKRGLYLFSTSITTVARRHIWVELLKNGQTLARIIACGEAEFDQGSVTVLTLLEPGDEVYVRLAHGGNGSIWGNWYTSFTGVLLSET